MSTFTLNGNGGIGGGVAGKPLFDRAFSLQVGPKVGGFFNLIDVSELACTFKVKRTIKPEPNTCECRIYNLSLQSRKQLESAAKLTVRLAAGYGDKPGEIYYGEVRTASTYTDGTENITEISSGDGEDEIRKARINTSFPPSTTPVQVLTALAKALGVGPGNVAVAVAKLQATGIASYFTQGGAMHGNAAQELTHFCRSVGLEWSIQSGQLLFLERGKPSLGVGYILSADTGLRGSPTVDNKGVLRATAAMLPDVKPGSIVVMDSKYVKGGYRVQEIEYVGETHGNSWDIHIVGKKY